MADTFAKYHCNYCEENIGGLRIRCLECEDFDLCLKCFACGAEIGKHKAFHGYQFMHELDQPLQDTGNFTIFAGQGQWSAREEVRLLDAIEQYGYGNWEDIALHIETRTPEETRLKYISSYINGTVGTATWKNAKDKLSLPLEHTVMDTGPLSPTLSSSVSNEPLSIEETMPLGFMPHRDDFEREWDNDCEASIASLFIHPVDDDDLDIALKLIQVDMYIRRLRERARRKRVAKDFHLVQLFHKKEREKSIISSTAKRKFKDEKDVLTEKLIPVSQFHTSREHQNFIDSLCREKELKIRIKELARYHRNGIKHIEECQEFEVSRIRRERRNDGKKKASSIFSPLNDSQQKSRENDARSPKSSAERRHTPPDTGAGKWPNGNYSDYSNWSSSSSQMLPSPSSSTEGAYEELSVSVCSLPGFRLLSSREKKENGEARCGMSSSGLLSGVACLPELDQHSHIRLARFMIQSGWISS